MPVNTLMPSDRRALAPAPVARTSGRTPRMNANDVMRMGRNRVRAASTADSMMGLLSMVRSSRATSTIRIPFLADSAINSIMPICT